MSNLQFVDLKATSADQKSRRLKIEEHGDPRKGNVRPKIRLIGRWLERAGFKHGSHVHVTCIASGILELRANGATVTSTESSPDFETVLAAFPKV